MIDFIIENWKFLFCCLLALIEFFVILLKRPVKIDSVKDRLAQILPLYIEYAERFFMYKPKSGLDKLNFVLNGVKDLLRIDSKDYDAFIIESIERILSTPTKKKGEIDEKSKNDACA